MEKLTIKCVHLLHAVQYIYIHICPIKKYALFSRICFFRFSKFVLFLYS